MHRCLLFLFLLTGLYSLKAQDPCAVLNYHAFKAEVIQGTYTDLEDLGTEIFPDDLDDGNSTAHDIGFEFIFHCQPFTQFILNTNGFIKLGAETTPKDNLFFSNAQSVSGGVFQNADSNNVNLIVPFNHDIERGVDEPDFRVYTNGTAPYRACTIQWENMREWTYDPAKQYDNMDFQVKLYETTNVIEFVYGEWDPSTNTSNYKTAAVGLKGAGPEEDEVLVVIKTSAASWDQVRFKDGHYAPNEAFNFGNPPDRPKPVSGITYRFTPTYGHDLSILEIYGAGHASSYYSTPQFISTRVRNSGFETRTQIPVILETLPDREYTDTQYIPSLAFGETARITFSPYRPAMNQTALLSVRLGDDDAPADNTRNLMQTTSDFELNVTQAGMHDGAIGYLEGVQGIHYTRYDIHGEARIASVNVFISEDTACIGKTVFAAVLNQQGQLVARTENTMITTDDLLGWKSFPIADPPVIRDASFYAGFGMVSASQAYKALGVQDENPLRPNTYYTSFITGNGLVAADTLTSTDRYMIGVTLSGTPPVAGTIHGDAMICNGENAAMSLSGYTGFITWQASPAGTGEWENVSEDRASDSFLTPALSQSLDYRTEVIQPGFSAVVSETHAVDVIAATPLITASGDVLISSAAEGNQWYDENGPIDGATAPLYLVTVPGIYYVIVSIEGCVSPPSNRVEILTVSVEDETITSGVRIYPNPVKDLIMVDPGEKTEMLELRVFDIQGREVFHSFFTGPGMVACETWPIGPYIVQVNGRELSTARRIQKM